MGKIVARMGDGDRVDMTEAEVQQDLEEGSQDAAERAKIPPLTSDEIAYLMELYRRKDRVVGVEDSKACCLSYDNQTSKIERAHIPVSKFQQLALFERCLGADTLELTHIDYSFKQVKHVVIYDKPNMEQAVLSTIAPIFYGAMPNLGLYSVPDGPVANPMDLIPADRIDEAIRLILLLHGMILSFGGIPLLYYGDEIGTLNDISYMDDISKANDNRWIHRPRIDWEKTENRHSHGSHEHRLFTSLQKMIAARKAIPAFADFNNREVIDVKNPHLFVFLRSLPAREGGDVLVIANFDVHPQHLELSDLGNRGYFQHNRLTDLYSGESPPVFKDQLVIAPPHRLREGPGGHHVAVPGRGAHHKHAGRCHWAVRSLLGANGTTLHAPPQRAPGPAAAPRPPAPPPRHAAVIDPISGLDTLAPPCVHDAMSASPPSEPSRRRPPWALYPKLVSVCVVLGGFASVLVLTLVHPRDDLEAWRRMLDVVSPLFLYLIVPASFLLAVTSVAMLVPRWRELLRQRWMQVKLILVVATLPALHLMARSTFEAMRREVRPGSSPEGPTGLFGLFQNLVIASLVVVLAALWIARYKPWRRR